MTKLVSREVLLTITEGITEFIDFDLDFGKVYHALADVAVKLTGETPESTYYNIRTYREFPDAQIVADAARQYLALLPDTIGDFKIEDKEVQRVDNIVTSLYVMASKNINDFDIDLSNYKDWIVVKTVELDSDDCDDDDDFSF